MRIEQLLAFKSVADERSYTRAAEKEFLTQPAIYSQVRQLETECGAKLFYTAGKQVLLTEAGQDLYQLAEEVDRSHAAFAARIEQRRRDSAHVVRVGAHAFFGVIRAAARRFSAADPDGTVEFHSMRPAGAIEAIRAGRVDFGFFGPGFSKDGLESELCAVNRIVCAAPIGHPLAGRRVSFDEFAASPIVGYAKGPGSARAAIDGWLREREVTVQYAAQADSSVAVKTLCLALGMPAFVVAASIEEDLEIGTIAIVDVAGFAPSYPLYVVHDGLEHLGAAALTFRRYLLGLRDEAERNDGPPAVVRREPVVSGC